MIVRRRYFCWLSHICLYAVHLGEGNLLSVNLHADSVTGHGAIFKKGLLKLLMTGERGKGKFASDMKKWGQLSKSYLRGLG